MARDLWKLVRDRYDSPAEREHYRARVDAGLRPWEERVLARHLEDPAPWLDIGCGAGREALALAGRGHRIVGLDTSREQLRQADGGTPGTAPQPRSR